MHGLKAPYFVGDQYIFSLGFNHLTIVHLEIFENIFLIDNHVQYFSIYNTGPTRLWYKLQHRNYIDNIDNPPDETFFIDWSFIIIWRTSGPFFTIFFLCCPSQRSADGQVPSQEMGNQRRDAGFEPGTAGQQSGALPLSHHASLSWATTPLSEPPRLSNEPPRVSKEPPRLSKSHHASLEPPRLSDETWGFLWI